MIRIVKLNVFLMFISNQHANAVTDLFSKERKKSKLLNLWWFSNWKNKVLHGHRIRTY